MRTRVPRPALALPAAALSAVLLTGCGGDAPDVSEPTPGGDTATGTTEPTATGTTEPTATGTTETPTEDATDPATTTETDEPTDEPTDDEAEDDTEDGTPTDGPTDGEDEDGDTEEVVSADESFSMVIPEGWEDISPDFEEMQLAVRSNEERHSFYDNFVVSTGPSVPDLRESAEQTGQELAGDEDFEMLEARTVDGEDAFGYVLTRELSGTEVAQTQWYVQHDDTLYVFTMSSSADGVEEASAVMDEVLASWTWLD